MSFSPDPSIGFVSTFPPTVCGIASYTESLVAAISDGNPGNLTGVVSLMEGPTERSPSPVLMHHRTGNRGSLRQATQLLNTFDAVSIQHEFGIWGQRDGVEVLDFISRLSVPTAVTLHTVLEDPTRSQRSITERLCRLADRIVVMSQTASTRLAQRYGADPDRISVIPHGADPRLAGPSLATGDRPLILTWGLIGPGKGLESAIRALTEIADMRPLPRYLIAGATHPHVRQDSGEAYRTGLMALTQSLGLGSMVEFDDRYLDRRNLARLVRSADVVLIPYESAEQVTSGVLVEAIAASKPVVATQFPHAVELLSGGAGAVVPSGEVRLLGAKLRQILSDQPTRDYMTSRTRFLAADWYWPTIGGQFAGVMADIVPSPAASVPASRGRHNVA
jgi:glycosyltransferase involved in cell wall biosynthesis